VEEAPSVVKLSDFTEPSIRTIITTSTLGNISGIFSLVFSHHISSLVFSQWCNRFTV